jgi:outer membrane protein assembly factor BamA
MKLFGILILTLIAGFTVCAQKGADLPDTRPCSQDAVEKQNMIVEAEAAEFNVRRIEIVGNTYSRYRVFSRKMAFNEGDIFTSARLSKSINGLNGLDVIEPITIDNVEIRLDRKNRQMDFVFCVVQKDKN